jgi:hypothetical protein
MQVSAVEALLRILSRRPGPGAGVDTTLLPLRPASEMRVAAPAIQSAGKLHAVVQLPSDPVDDLLFAAPRPGVSVSGTVSSQTLENINLNSTEQRGRTWESFSNGSGMAALIRNERPDTTSHVAEPFNPSEMDRLHAISTPTHVIGRTAQEAHQFERQSFPLIHAALAAVVIITAAIVGAALVG